MGKVEKYYNNGKFQITLFRNKANGKSYDSIRVKKSLIKYNKPLINKKGEQAIDIYPSELAMIRGVMELMENYYFKKRLEKE